MHSTPLSHRLLSCLLALLVLAASVGLPVQRRTCRLSGRSMARIAWTVAALRTGSPNSTSQTGPRLASGCYDYHLELHQLRTQATAPPATKLFAVPAALLGVLTVAVMRPLSAARGAESSVESTQAVASPQRPSGRRLLVRLRCWLV